MGEGEGESCLFAIPMLSKIIQSVLWSFGFFSFIEEKHSSGKTVPIEIKPCSPDHASLNILSGGMAVWDQLEAVTEVHQTRSALPLLATFLQQILPLLGVP